MKQAEREERNRNALRMYLAGATYQQIADSIGLRSIGSIHVIIKKMLATEYQRRDLLSDEAFAIYQERTERLFQAHWAPALRGDHRSAEVCRKILGQQARLYGIDVSDVKLPDPTATFDADNGEETFEEPQDELARLRAERAGA